MPNTTPEHGLPYPTYTDPTNAAAQIKALAQQMDVFLAGAQSAIESVRERVAAGISATAAQTLTNNVVANLAFDTVDFGDPTMGVLSDGSIHFTTPGFYLVTAGCSFTSNGTGNRQLTLVMGGTGGDVISGFRQPAANSGTSSIRMDIAGLTTFRAGDEIGAHVIQTSGGNLTVTNRYLQAVHLS